MHIGLHWQQDMPGKEMSYNFSEMKKFTTWRKLWVDLAKSEKVRLLLLSNSMS